MRVTSILSLGFLGSSFASLPSCEDDTATHCLGDDADFSPEGIDACLRGLGNLQTPGCVAYLALIDACTAEFADGGVCGGDFANGDGMPCLLQRIKPEELSAACAAALPAPEKSDLGLSETFWKDGKRFLGDEEIAQLSEDDADTYSRWVKRKQKSGGRNKDREFAIQKKKKAKASQLIQFQASGAATKALEAGLSEKEAKKAAAKVVKAEAKKAVKADPKLEKFTKEEIKEIAVAAVKAAQEEIRQESKRKAEL